ncbi:MAG: RimK family alpha-L-glutamate ligase [Candidatus Hodarchaeota archaeon]
MDFGLIAQRFDDLEVQDLFQELKNQNISCVFFSTSQVNIKTTKPRFTLGNDTILDNLDACLVRGLGATDLEHTIFRVDVLHALSLAGIPLINSPRSVELAADKTFSSVLFSLNGIPTPPTIIIESADDGLKGFEELGGDVVVKPMFGSQGRGIDRVTNKAEAVRVFQDRLKNDQVIYMQKFISCMMNDEFYDIRAFVIGSEVVASMYRVSSSWKTNIHAGGRPEPCTLTPELDELSIRVSEVIGCEVAGVDIIETEDGPQVLEINSVPGWRGIQRVVNVNIPHLYVDYVKAKVKR